MEAVSIPHCNHSIVVGLFKDVRNAGFLRSQLVQGNTQFEYAFLDASVLFSRQQVMAACFRAINDLQHDRLKSRNVHSEIVFSLSPNNNIAESFRRFGIGETTTSIAAIKVGSTLDDVQRHLMSSVEGTLVPLTDEKLTLVRDEARIRKIYRVEAVKKGEKTGLDWHDEAFILGSMALKGS